MDDINLQLLTNAVKQVSDEYGLLYNVFPFREGEQHPDSGDYVIVGYTPEIYNVSPVEIINREARTPNLFYPDMYAIKVKQGSTLDIIDSITRWAICAEVLNSLYVNHNLPVPKRVRDCIATSLLEANDYIADKNFNADAKDIYKNMIEEYFAKVKSRGPLARAYNEFYNSERFNVSKKHNKLGNILRFIFRKNQQVTLKELTNTLYSTKMEYIRETEYKLLKNALKQYPDISYCVSKKHVVKEKVIKDKNNPWYGEPTFPDYRKMNFRCVDEPIIAMLLNRMRLSYAEESPIDEETEHLEMPIEDFLNFASLAKSNNVPYQIDEDRSRLETVSVSIGWSCFSVVDSMFSDIIEEKAKLLHATTEPERISFRTKLKELQEEYRIDEPVYETPRVQLSPPEEVCR